MCSHQENANVHGAGSMSGDLGEAFVSRNLSDGHHLESFPEDSMDT